MPASENRGEWEMVRKERKSSTTTVKKREKDLSLRKGGGIIFLASMGGEGREEVCSPTI